MTRECELVVGHVFKFVIYNSGITPHSRLINLLSVRFRTLFFFITHMSDASDAVSATREAAGTCEAAIVSDSVPYQDTHFTQDLSLRVTELDVDHYTEQKT